MNTDRRRFGAALAGVGAWGGLRASGALLAGTFAGAAAAAPSVAPRHSIASASRFAATRLIRPPRLQPRSVVGLIAPGGIVDDSIIEKCVKNLESLGFRVKLGKHIRAAHGGYAGTVAQRLDDLHGMFLDREVGAIWTARGGSGCTALLPHIDYGMIRRNPKILIGYSDITALHLALYRQAGLVSFHGPVAWSTFSDYSVNHMLSVLMEPQREYAIHMSIENSRRAEKETQFALRTIRPGTAEGRLIGGNLAVMSALIGTPYAADIRSRLVFLEEVGEAPYRIDRLLIQLDQSAGLKRAAGYMLGVFQKSAASGNEPSLSLAEIVDDHFASLPVPAVYGYSFGHIAQQFTIPVGILARLDTEAETLTLLEPATAA
jgi:muramoyltetrapeptide carboxypeptidase